jgi:hypothetical protein
MKKFIVTLFGVIVAPIAAIIAGDQLIGGLGGFFLALLLTSIDCYLVAKWMKLWDIRG